jgi:phosphoglycolate phosphatase
VGDSVTDAETARRARVPFAAVLNGVTSREAFKNYPAYRILDNLCELIDKK